MRRPVSIHRLLIRLDDVEPPVWRRIEVDSDASLASLSDWLVSAMGWDGYHQHRFEADGVEYLLQSPEVEPWGEDEAQFAIDDVVGEPGATMVWAYDFGDGWTHTVEVEAVGDPIEDAVYPVCLEGGRACPPEDCGGPGGYEQLLEALTDPQAPDHDDLVAWTADGFDPEAFDPSRATAQMHAPTWKP